MYKVVKAFGEERLENVLNQLTELGWFVQNIFQASTTVPASGKVENYYVVVASRRFKQ